MKVPRCLTELKPPFLKGFSSPVSIPGFLRILEHCIACYSVCKMIVLENAWMLTKLREQRKQQEGNLWSEVWMVGHEPPVHLCWWSRFSKICLWPQWVMSPFYTETTPLLPPPAGVVLRLFVSGSVAMTLSTFLSAEPCAAFGNLPCSCPISGPDLVVTHSVMT